MTATELTHERMAAMFAEIRKLALEQMAWVAVLQLMERVAKCN